MKRNIHAFSPILLPVYFFGLAILLGAILLRLPLAQAGEGVSFLDALFTAVSATCVTGLITVDTGTVYSRFGQAVIVVLIQIGGLGVMTYSSLVFYMWRRRVTLADRIAVGQFLLNDPTFHLGRFLKQMFLVCLCIEALGAVGLRVGTAGEMSWSNAFFHSISAFCNAGFSLYPDNMMRYAENPFVNFTLMTLIICGGIGFYVLVDLAGFFSAFLRRTKRALSWQSTVVIRTSLYLTVAGAVVFFLVEEAPNLRSGFLSALFQSVSARTAGFNTVDIGQMTDTSLFILMLLMVVGGSPGSCAGGIKTTTLRVLLAFGVSQVKGREQVVVSGYAMDSTTINKAMTVTILAFVLILSAVFILSMTEGADISHQLVRGKFIEIFFEAASAFGTVGLSTGLTSKLSDPGKIVIMILMFVGRLGPIVFLGIVQSWQKREMFQRAERNLLIG